MKKIILSLATLAISCHSFAANIPPLPQINASAYVVEDLQGGKILAENNLNERVEPASLTKLMTAYMVFKSLKENKLKEDELLNVSDKAWKAEGSRMFVDPKVPVSVSDLIKGVIVQSGNDACIVLAEAIAGSEEGFAVMMNAEAKRLGMKNTHFENSTGLPGENHYTSVKDLAILAAAIIRDFPEYYPIYSMKSFEYNKIKQMNRNLLLYRDSSVDGLKTGHTASAGYNLVASSKRNGRRVISVVVGTSGPEVRATESSKLLNWALQSFETPKLYNANQAVSNVKVYKGKDNELAIGFLQDAYFTVPYGEVKALKPVLETVQPVVAPVKQGQKLGVLKLVDENNQIIASRDVVALKEVKEAGFLSRLWDSMVLWIKSFFN